MKRSLSILALTLANSLVVTALTQPTLLPAHASQTSRRQSDLPKLELGKPIERELAGGQSHSYQLTLSAGQFLHVIVEQRGIDVVVLLYAPDGKQLIEADSPNGSLGSEPLLTLIKTSGTYPWPGLLPAGQA